MANNEEATEQEVDAAVILISRLNLGSRVYSLDQVAVEFCYLAGFTMMNKLIAQGTIGFL